MKAANVIYVDFRAKRRMHGELLPLAVSMLLAAGVSYFLADLFKF